MTKHKTGFTDSLNFKAKIQTHVQGGNTYFLRFPKWTDNLHLIFPTDSWELRHIRWHKMTSHPRPGGSCDNRPLTSKSSLDQTTASCTVAKKQSPKYVYPRRAALMLIKMNNSNQLMRMHAWHRGEIIPKWWVELVLQRLQWEPWSRTPWVVNKSI